MKVEIRTSYDFANFPAMDDVIAAQVGGDAHFAGSDFSGRDLGWVVGSEFEAARIERGLRKLNLPIKRREIADT